MDFNRTLLIVDDEAEALNGYRDFLAPARPSSRRSSRREASAPPSGEQKEEYKLLLASSGEQAIDLVKTELSNGGRIAAGFFDVKLGSGMDGLTAIQKVRALDPDIHCVVVTAYHDRSVEDIAALFGDEFSDRWDYLNKPFSQGEIVQKARQMTAAWNRAKQLAFMNDQLVKSERLAAIGQLARGIGHEFGNILLRIMGKADLALMESNVDKIKEHIQVVLKASERAGVIVRNLQSVARSTSNAVPQFTEALLRVPVDEALSLVNHELTKASVKVVTSFLPVPPCRMDCGALAQVFLNLLINATQAMEKGGTITIAVERRQNSNGKPGVVAVVTDTGTGISPDVLPRIFDFAYSTKGDRGSGLGLAISREIVHRHDGEITVKTEVGKGSEFSVWLPSISE